MVWSQKLQKTPKVQHLTLIYIDTISPHAKTIERREGGTILNKLG
jgi:hypothetical protein